MNVYHYMCSNCAAEFISENVLYCPFCDSPLQQQGLAEYAPRDYVTAGWNCIAFRSTKAGFILKDVVIAGNYGGHVVRNKVAGNREETCP